MGHLLGFYFCQWLMNMALLHGSAEERCETWQSFAARNLERLTL
jgi:hypothetical protein